MTLHDYGSNVQVANVVQVILAVRDSAVILPKLRSVMNGVPALVILIADLQCARRFGMEHVRLSTVGRHFSHTSAAVAMRFRSVQRASRPRVLWCIRGPAGGVADVPRSHEAAKKNKSHEC